MTGAMATPSWGHVDIERRIPHRGRMCLLDRLESWNAGAIHCSAVGQRDADHPLRHHAHGLLAPVAIEYAAQSTALHQALVLEQAGDPDAAARPGFIASARDVRLHCLRLDDIPGRLQVHASLQHGSANQALYRFRLEDDHRRVLVEGRLTVVLDTPLLPR